MAPEIVDAVKTGWLLAVGPVLDIGCGLGEIAAWFAGRGCEALGFVVAESAVRSARKAHAPLPPILEFMALDACASPLPNRQFTTFVDRGCMHTIPPAALASYARNIASVAAPDARMLLFMRVFRHGRPFAEPVETQSLVERVGDSYAGKFELARHAPTYLDRHGGKEPASALPGLVLWLVASRAAAWNRQRSVPGCLHRSAAAAEETTR